MTTELMAENESEPATKSDNIIYYIVGYLVLRYKRRKDNRRCPSCLSSMDCGLKNLPEDFSAHQFTELKTRGGLRFAGTDLFHLIRMVEEEVQKVLSVPRGIFDPSAFQNILYSLCEKTLPRVGCQEHHLELMTTLIQDFLTLRMKYIAKQKKIELFQHDRAATLAHNKLGKINS